MNTSVSGETDSVLGDSDDAESSTDEGSDDK